MKWIAYTHILTKTCKLPTIVINGYEFPSRETAYAWVNEQMAQYGLRLLKSGVHQHETI